MPKVVDVTGGWNNSHYEDNYYRHSAANIIRLIESRTIRWAERVTPVGGRRGVCMILVGKPAERRPLGRPRHRWEDNITLTFRKEIVRKGVDWIHPAWEWDKWRAFVIAAMNLLIS